MNWLIDGASEGSAEVVFTPRHRVQKGRSQHKLIHNPFLAPDFKCVVGPELTLGCTHDERVYT